MRLALTALPAHARTVALLLLSLLALVLAVVLLRLGTWYWEQHQRVVDMEPRIARLYGYRDSESALRQASSLAGEQLQGLVFGDVDSATVGATVQQQVRRLLQDAGMEPLSSEVAGSSAQEALEEIRVNVTGSGPIEAFDQLLADIANARPVLFIDALEITPLRGRRDDVQQSVHVSLTLKAVRVL